MVYPLKYGAENEEPDLLQRGKNFWMCRNEIYVSYDDADIFGDPVQVSRCTFFKGSFETTHLLLRSGVQGI
jgi:hypothetical protein